MQLEPDNCTYLSNMCTSKAIPGSLATSLVLILLTQRPMHKRKQECNPFLKRGEQAPIPQPVPATSESHESNTHVIELLLALFGKWEHVRFFGKEVHFCLSVGIQDAESASTH